MFIIFEGINLVENFKVNFVEIYEGHRTEKEEYIVSNDYHYIYVFSLFCSANIWLLSVLKLHVKTGVPFIYCLYNYIYLFLYPKEYLLSAYCGYYSHNVICINEISRTYCWNLTSSEIFNFVNFSTAFISKIPL
jgi:hypothetical protein